MKNKILVIIIVFMMGSSLFIPKTAFAADDISGHYFESSLRSLIQQGIMGGYSDNVYKPDSHVTRAEFTSFLVRALNLSQMTTTKSFTDVSQGQWYTGPVTTATSHNLIGGYTDGTFKPNSKISRQEMAAMIQRALTSQGIIAGEQTLKFTDTTEINTIFRPAVQNLLYLGIMSGKGGNRFAPNDYTTRGETAAVIDRMLTRIGNPKLIVSNTHYNLDFNKMIDIQMTRTPKVDGAGIYLASRSLVEYYANPKNFNSDSSEYLQFLDLSQNTGLNATEINEKVLTNKGTLSGTAASFIEAAKTHNVNEVYLIAHALHETGNGNSTLAKGIPVDENGKIVSADKAVHTVYNYYGYGAVDSDPINGGAMFAFKNKWFSPKTAIVGGAATIANNYINDGQNTLYKMRWNPDSPGYPQYATHVMWAVLQTDRMHQIYDSVDSYVLKLDVPTFNNQPVAITKPAGIAQYAIDTKLAGEKALTNTNTLNLRSGPTTNFASIGTLNRNTNVTIIGKNGGWYKVKVDTTSLVGWVSGIYLDLEMDKLVPSPPNSENDDLLDGDNLQDTETSARKISVSTETTSILRGAFGITRTENVLVRSEPNATNAENIITLLNNETQVEIIGQQENWFKIVIDNQEGWVMDDAILPINLLEVTATTDARTEPNGESKVVRELLDDAVIVGSIDENQQLITNGEWYQVTIDKEIAWVHKEFITSN